MKWNYSTLAKTYPKRAPYSKRALDKMCELFKDAKNVCDIGAGTGFLSKELADRKFNIKALEPNDEMRKVGIESTKDYSNILWKKALAEETNEEDQLYDVVTFGSSFNVCDKQKAFLEAKRIVKPKGWFACMWNHRDLSDPIQKQIEDIIKGNISDYSYGDRRQDQMAILKESDLFNDIYFFCESFKHNHKIIDVLDAWKSHGTLYNQAKDKFEVIIKSIEEFLFSLKKDSIDILYDTKIWVAQFK